MIFDRLAIGTANWGREYNGAKVSEDDQKRILDYCRKVGINMIDTATAYEWDWTKIDSWFKVVVKVKAEDNAEQIIDSRPYCIMSHDYGYYKSAFLLDYSIPRGCQSKLGVSLYYGQRGTLDHLTCIDVVQISYSLYDRRFERQIKQVGELWIGKQEIHVRSVFLHGKILEVFSPQECISFCLMNPCVNRVIIGADSYEQFRENVQPLREMCEAKKEDENLLDPRKWKEEK